MMNFSSSSLFYRCHKHLLYRNVLQTTPGHFSCVAYSTLSDGTKVIKVSNESDKSKKHVYKRKSAHVLHQVRSTDKYFYGPLVENSTNVVRPKKEKTTTKKTAAKTKGTRWTKYVEEYEHFACMHSGSYVSNGSLNSRTRQASKNNMKSELSNNYISKEISTERNVAVDKGVLLDKSSNVKIYASDKINSIVTPSLLCVDNSNFPDVPNEIDLTSLRNYPLFNEDNRPCNNSPPGRAISVSYRGAGERRLPSVSKILNDTMSTASRAALLKWEAKMIAKLGQQGFQDYKKELFAQGSLLHSCIQQRLQDGTEPSEQQLHQLDGHWRSVGQVVNEMDGVTAVESRITHPDLHYAGILDCVATYRDTPVLVEWKTSTQPKPSLQRCYDGPLQLAAYLGAMHCDPNYAGLSKVQSGFIAYSYLSGTKSDTHLLSPAQLQRYWNAWLQRLELFWQLNAQT